MMPECHVLAVLYHVVWTDADGNDVVELDNVTANALNDFPLGMQPGDTVCVSRTS
jgi:hypothetical protein